MFKLGISAGLRSEMKLEDQLPLIKAAGFDSFFTSWSPTQPIETYANIAQKCGLIYETLHAPFDHMNDMWLDNIEGDACLKRLMSCVDSCSNNGIGKMITHVTVSSVAPPVSKIGETRFGKLIEHADKSSVKIALENLEIPEHLSYLFDKFSDCKNVGFCWDCGHNNCYTPNTDMMELYSDRLICTHIHDNFGVKNPPIITWHDDLHYMPFDGNIDFSEFGKKIKKSGYQDILTVELNVQAKPEYKVLSTEDFIKEAYKRALKIAELCK